MKLQAVKWEKEKRRMSEGKSHCSTSKSPGEIIVNLGYIRMLQCPVGYHTGGKKNIYH